MSDPLGGRRERVLLGRYQILDRLGAGGMGVVYRGVALGVDGFKKPVVIKRIRGLARRQRPDVLVRFVNEARILMAMSHGNVVQILDLGKLADEYFMVLEYVEGVDLSTLLERCVALGTWPSQPLSLLIVGQVLRGLDYAHRRTDEQGRSLGIVHRDLKPANVLCSVEGEIKLTDFGVASLAGAGLTQVGDLIGTACYMSPEQASGERVDQRSDIFSVGTILYLLLCQRHPFPGADLEQVRQAVRNARLTPPAALGVELVPAVEQVLLDAMARDAGARHQSAAAMLRAVEEAQRSMLDVATSSDLQAFFRLLFGDDPASLRESAGRSASDSFVGTEIEGIVGPTGSPSTTSGRDHTGRLRALPNAETASVVDAAMERSDPSPTSAWSRRQRRVVALVAGGLLLVGVAVTGAVVAAVDCVPAASPAVDLRLAGDDRGVSGAARIVAIDADVDTADQEDAQGAVASLRPATDAGLDAQQATPPRERVGRRGPGPRRSRPARWGWVLVSTRPAYAEVFADRQRLGTTPCRVRMPVGTYELRLVNQGLGLTVRRTVTVRPDEETRLTLERFGALEP